MLFIPDELIALVTFPGVVMHEIAHRFMCDLLHIPVYHVNYFSIGDKNAGHVLHQETKNVLHSFLISFAPLFINSFFCILFTFPYSSSAFVTGDGITTFSNGFLMWVGMSMGIQAFPSDRDLENVSSKTEGFYNFFIISPLCSFVRLVNTLRFIGINIVYSYGITLILPYLVFSTH